jgi:hypothetical protein
MLTIDLLIMDWGFREAKGAAMELFPGPGPGTTMPSGGITIAALLIKTESAHPTHNTAAIQTGIGQSVTSGPRFDEFKDEALPLRRARRFPGSVPDQFARTLR